MDRVSGLDVFVKVVEERSFSSAAQKLGLSKSAVSKQITRLEDRLGARLLNRTTRSLNLTEAGENFYARAVRILADLEDAEAAVTTLQAKPRGVLKVNAPMSFGILHVAPLLADFMARHPDLSVDLNLDDRYVDLIEEGFDMAIRIADLPDSTLIARRLAPFRGVYCAAPAYLERRGVPRTPEDLRDHEVLHYSYLSGRNEITYAKGGRTRSIPLSGRLSANNGDVLRRAVCDGLGICYVPTFLVGEDLKEGRLRAVLGAYAGASSDHAIHAVYPHGRHLSAKVRAFVDFLVERLGDAPYWDEDLPPAIS